MLKIEQCKLFNTLRHNKNKNRREFAASYLNEPVMYSISIKNNCFYVEELKNPNCEFHSLVSNIY